MDKSGAEIEKETDSMKLLYRYQYAFLNMQKHYTRLIKVMRTLNQKAVLRSIKLWHLNVCSFNFITPQINDFKFSLKSVEFKFNKMLKLRQYKSFSQVISFSLLKESYDLFFENYKAEKEKSQKELKMMDSEIKNLKMNQAELEIITSYYAKNEGVGKGKGKNTSRNLLEEIANENLELERHIDDIDRKTVELFEELNLALDNFEQNKKSKGKRNKKKISSSIRRSYLQAYY